MTDEVKSEQVGEAGVDERDFFIQKLPNPERGQPHGAGCQAKLFGDLGPGAALVLKLIENLPGLFADSFADTREGHVAYLFTGKLIKAVDQIFAGRRGFELLLRNNLLDIVNRHHLNACGLFEDVHPGVASNLP